MAAGKDYRGLAGTSETMSVHACQMDPIMAGLPVLINQWQCGALEKATRRSCAPQSSCKRAYGPCHGEEAEKKTSMLMYAECVEGMAIPV